MKEDKKGREKAYVIFMLLLLGLGLIIFIQFSRPLKFNLQMKIRKRIEKEEGNNQIKFSRSMNKRDIKTMKMKY